MKKSHYMTLILLIALVTIMSVVIITKQSYSFGVSYDELDDAGRKDRNTLLNSLDNKPNFLEGVKFDTEEGKQSSEDYEKYFSDFKLTEAEEVYYNMSEEKLEEYLETRDTSRAVSVTVEDYLRNVGLKMAAALCRIRYTEDTLASFKLTNPVLRQEGMLDSDNQSVDVYQSDVIVGLNTLAPDGSHNISYYLIAKVNVIKNLDTQDTSLTLFECTEESIENITNIFISKDGSAAFDQSINTLVYRIPMYEYPQQVGDVYLNLCAITCLSSMLSSYREVYTPPYITMRAIAPVLYDNETEDPRILDNFRTLSVYDENIKYRDFTGISQYAVEDFMSTMTKVNRYNSTQSGTIQGAASSINKNIPQLITVIKNGDRKDVPMTGSKKTDIPSHIFLLNGTVDNTIVIGVNTGKAIYNSNHPAQLFMMYGSSEYISKTHIYIEGSEGTNNRLYLVNDIIKPRDPVKYTNTNNTEPVALNAEVQELDDYMAHLEQYINLEYDHYVQEGKNYLLDYHYYTMNLFSAADDILKATDPVTKLPKEPKLNRVAEEERSVSGEGGLLSPEVLASSLGISRMALLKLCSGYAPYSLSQVLDYIDLHPECYMLAVIINSTESIDEDTRVDLTGSDIHLIYDDSNIKNPINFIATALKVRKHPVNTVLNGKSYLIEALDKDISGGYSNYVIAAYKNNDTGKITFGIISGYQGKFSSGNYYFEVYKLINDIDPDEELLILPSGSFTNNSGYLFEDIGEYITGSENYTRLGMISTPIHVSKDITNNFYFKTTSTGQGTLVNIG